MKTLVTLPALVALLVLGAAGRADEKEPATEQEFLAKSVEGDVAEIKMSQLAVANAESDEVKKLARRMIDDHTKKRAMLLTHAKTLKVTVDEKVSAKCQEKIDQLTRLKGKDFDREYLRAQLESHEKALKLHEKWARDARDPGLKETATKAVPTIKDHLEHVRKLAGEK